ncbi:MAG: hypothetical protein WAL61_16430 [Acidimicrobiales bacterium]
MSTSTVGVGAFRARRWAALGAALAVLAAGLVAFALPSGAASGQARPSITVTPATASPNERVTVTGRGFPPDSDIQTQICGNNALNGSADCVQSTAQEVSTTKSGLFQMQLVVTIPSKPCPCVVMALDFSSSVTPTAPITIIGAPVAAPAGSRIHKLQVLDAYLTGNGPWTAWFGAPPQRTLVVTVRNPNNAAYVNPPLILAIGNAGDTTTHEATTQNLPTIGANATNTYRIPVSFPAVSIGEHQVVGIVGESGLSRAFKVQTWLFPWGLLLAALIVLELLLLAITRYFRERRRRKEEAEGAAGVPGDLDDAPPTGEVPAVGEPVGAAVGVGALAGGPAEAAGGEVAPERPPHPPVL